MEITKEEENFFRVQKWVHDEFPINLRILFIKKWCEKFAKWEDSLDDGEELWKKISKKKVDKYVEKKIKTGNSKDWDGSCLRQALDCPGLKRTYERAEITRLYEIRNEASHAPSSKLSQKETDEIFKTVKEVYKKLKWQTNMVERIESEEMKTAEMKKLESKLLAEKQKALRDNQEDLCTLPPEIKNFVGREREIEDFIDRFTSQDRNSENNFFVIHGGPCYGKSSLAIMLGHKMFAKGYNYVIWINMRDNSENPSMEDVAFKILSEFGIDTSEMKSDIVSYLNTKLESITASGKKALLILDNADNLLQSNTGESVSSSTFQELTRLIRNNSRESIRAIFTTRSCKFLDDEFFKVKIHSLNKEISEKFIQAELVSTPPERDVIEQLVEICDGLPLALKITASVVNRMEDKDMLEDYLTDLKQNPIDTVSEDSSSNIKHLFQASFKYLKPEELELLQMLAVFRSGFSYAYVKKLSDTFKLKARLLDSLIRHGLVNKDSQNYIIHSFLCDYLRKCEWKEGMRPAFEKEYYKLYLQRLFELTRDSLEKDNYVICLNEFRVEQYNFIHVMGQIDKGFPRDDHSATLIIDLQMLIDRPTPDYIAALHFLIDLVTPSLLVGFFNDCEKHSISHVQPNISCCRYDASKKYYQQTDMKAPTYNKLDEYGKALFDKRKMTDEIHNANMKDYKREQFATHRSKLDEFSIRATRLENVKMRAYFSHKILKLKTRVFKKASQQNDKAIHRKATIDAHLEALEICKDAFGNNWLTIDCYNQLAKSLWTFEENEKALEAFTEAEKMAEEMSLRESKKFGSIMLDKGRFLISTGIPDNVKEGTALLKKTLEMCKDVSDTKFWCLAMKSLYTVDMSYREKIMQYFLTQEKPSRPLFSLISFKFNHELEKLSKEFDESIALDNGNEIVNDLKKAIEHLEKIKSQNKEHNNDSKDTVAIFLFIWTMNLAKKCKRILTLSERKVFAKKALEIARYNDCVKDRNNELEIIVKENQEGVNETLLRRKHYLDSIAKNMTEKGMEKESRERYRSLLNECDGDQTVWSIIVLQQGKNDPTFYDNLPQYLSRQQQPCEILLKLVTTKFLYEISVIERQADEHKIRSKSLKAIDEMREAILFAERISSVTNITSGDPIIKSLTLWTKLLALKTDHILIKDERRPFAEKALVWSPESCSDIINAEDKKKLKLLTQPAGSNIEQELERKKSMLVKVTKYLRKNDGQRELERRYFQFLESSRNPAMQLSLIKFIIQQKNVSVDKYVEYLRFLPEHFERQQLTSAWDFNFMIEYIPLLLTNERSSSCRREGFDICQRVYECLASRRAKFSLYLQKKLEFKFLFILCSRVDPEFLPQREKRRYARVAIALDDRFQFCSKEADLQNHRDMLQEILHY